MPTYRLWDRVLGWFTIETPPPPPAPPPRSVYVVSERAHGQTIFHRVFVDQAAAHKFAEALRDKLKERKGRVRIEVEPVEYVA